jgi:pectinesterase
MTARRSISAMIAHLCSDFIFGRYTRIWFDEIDLRVRLASQGYITASERASPTDPSYFVFNNSTVMSAEDESVKPGSYFLGKCKWLVWIAY